MPELTGDPAARQPRDPVGEQRRVRRAAPVQGPEQQLRARGGCEVAGGAELPLLLAAVRRTAGRTHPVRSRRTLGGPDLAGPAPPSRLVFSGLRRLHITVIILYTLEN